MKRRDFFRTAGVGSAVIVSASALAGRRPEALQNHEHKPLDGPLASAVVSFGQWKTTPPLDRFPNVPPPPPTNNHQLLPFEAKIKAGGSVMFIISGLHNILVYDDGTTAADISTAVTTPTTGVPKGVPLIDFAPGRLYRGPDPSLLPLLDRTETVLFPNPGRFFVMCGVLPHFLDDMFGFVKVLP